MRIIIDSNVVFSAILNPNGSIGDILLNSDNIFDFWCPTYLADELNNHTKKLMSISDLSRKEIVFLRRIIFRHIGFVDVFNVSEEIRKKAYEICKDVDENDTPFVALALELNGKLWTGDKKLSRGLQNKKMNITINTGELQIMKEKLAK